MSTSGTPRPRRGAPAPTLSASARIHSGRLPLATESGLREFEALARDLVSEANLVDLTDPVAKKKFHGAVMRVYFRLVKTGFQFRRDDAGKTLRAAMRHLRASARVIGMQQSSANFALHGTTTFGRELRSTVTILPDPGLGANFEFGSEPEPEHFVGPAKTMWAALKRRRYMDKSGILQNKNHYVLAHLLNHNVGGSGRDPQNLVPFWAAANTEMERTAETTLKTVVNDQGFRATWNVICGPDMGMTAQRSTLMAAILSRNGAAGRDQLKGDEQVRYDILNYEQHLPQFLTMTLKYWDLDDVETAVGLAPVNNFVPMTIPELV